MALDYFNGQPQTGSPVILLVFDGAARIEPEIQTALTHGLRRNGSAVNPRAAVLCC
jgi:hypothetical protein